ncbi:MAG: Gfo/Idh/MocA family protein [Planctomycetota bacterium]|jgi:predicted dehydrogenase
MSRKLTRRGGRKVRLGIAGLGMGLSHAMAGYKVRNMELAALADVDAKILEKKKERIVKKAKTGCFKWLSSVPMYADYRRMVKEAELDAVLIALPTSMHVSASEFALGAGVNVLCEKPPSVKADEMAGVAELSRKRGLTYMYVRQQRFEPAKQVVRRMVARGQLGKIYHADSKWIRSGNIPFRHGWGVNKDHGGGVLLDLGVHVIDDGWFLMGCPRPVEVFAAMHCSFPHVRNGQKLELPYDADDGCMGTVLFEGGASMQFSTTFAMNTAGPRHLRRKEDTSIDWVELAVYGEKAGAEIHEDLLVRRKGKTEATSHKAIAAKRPGGKSNLTLQLEHFCDCVLTGKEVQNTPEQAVMLMQMLDAARRSAETGKSVSVRQLVKV